MIFIWTYNYTAELRHHGIKGQKWGVRRYQNYDGSLTAAGRKRYGVNVEGAKANYEKAKAEQKEALRYYYKKTGYGTLYNAEALKRLDDANRNTEWAKQDLNSEKIKQRLNDETKPKSKHRTKLEELYKSKGMTDEEAAVAAYKRERVEKILAVTAGVTVAVAATYVAYKMYDKNVDKIIRSGMTLSRISATDTMAVHDAFYASIKSSDATKYIGQYGKEFQDEGLDVFQKSIKTTDKIKIASEKNAKKILSDLVKSNPEYRNSLNDLISKANVVVANAGTPQQIRTVEKAINSLRKGKINSNVYDALNLSLTDKNHAAVKGFYRQMASKGYDAVIDINDKRLSGYMAKMPVVVFNSNKVAVEHVRKIGEQEIAKSFRSDVGKLTVRAFAEEYGKRALLWGSGFGAYKVTKNLTTGKRNDKIVSEYRKEHPNTELSYKEIVRNYYNKKVG